MLKRLTADIEAVVDRVVATVAFVCCALVCASFVLFACIWRSSRAA